ncbi:MAG TPA: adenylate/guanylate cyclase domain-containing protein [Salinarimonas sp.]|nr:adenylate/guanylate cyclase domain-containing protein [Salinarimonas sp.]
MDLLCTYVGPRTGRRIIEGGIDRGDYDVIEAAIWHADLRGFTRLSETRPTAEVIERLNAWLEPMVAAIQEHDGEVLRFIGDAVLAIFPTSPRRSPARACRTERKIAGKAARSARSRPLSLRKVAWAGADTP